MKIKCTLREIMDAPLANAWDEYCERSGLSVYAVKEGYPSDTEVDITVEEARRWGLLGGDDE